MSKKSPKTVAETKSSVLISDIITQLEFDREETLEPRFPFNFNYYWDLISEQYFPHLESSENMINTFQVVNKLSEDTVTNRKKNNKGKEGRVERFKEFIEGN